MKIYCSRNVDPIEEFNRYIKKICNKDAWIAIRIEDYRTSWVSAKEEGGILKYNLISNGAYYPYEYFIEEKANNYAEKEHWGINWDWIEIRKPVEIITTQELAKAVSNPEAGYSFEPLEEDDE